MNFEEYIAALRLAIESIGKKNKAGSKYILRSWCAPSGRFGVILFILTSPRGGDGRAEGPAQSPGPEDGPRRITGDHVTECKIGGTFPPGRTVRIRIGPDLNRISLTFDLDDRIRTLGFSEESIRKELERVLEEYDQRE